MSMNSVGPKSGRGQQAGWSPSIGATLAACSTDLRGRKIAILAALGADLAQINALVTALKDAGATAEIVSTARAPLGKSAGAPVATKSFFNTTPASWDGVYVPGGPGSIATLTARGDAAPFVREAFRQGKPIGGPAEGADFIDAAIAQEVPVQVGSGQLAGVVTARGGLLASFPAAFVGVLAAHVAPAAE